VKSSNLLLRLLLFIQIIVGISAIAGGVGLIFSNGLGMPTRWLAKTPFSSYVYPGLILFLAVGGTHILAVLLNIKKNRYSLLLSSVAGFGLLIWIFTEIYLIMNLSWLQVLLFGIAILELIIVILVLSLKNSK